MNTTQLVDRIKAAIAAFRTTRAPQPGALFISSNRS